MRVFVLTAGSLRAVHTKAHTAHSFSWDRNVTGNRVVHDVVRCSLLSKYHNVSLVTCNFIHVLQNSTVFPVSIFTKITITQLYYVKISYTEFYSDHSTNVGSKDGNSFTPCNKIVPPLCRFSRNKIVPPLCRISRNKIVPPLCRILRNKIVPQLCRFSKNKIVPPLCRFSQNKLVPPLCRFSENKIVPPLCRFSRNKIVPPLCRFSRNS